MSPIDSWDEATYVFTGGPDSFLTVLSVLVAVVMFVGFIAVMVRHEKHAYEAAKTGHH